MKLLTTAAAAVLITTTAHAADLGGGVTAGAELDSFWAMDAEALTVTLTPELGYDVWGNSFTASTDIDVYKDEKMVITDAFDTMIIDFEVTRDVMSNIEAYATTSWDLDKSERGEVKVGLSFSF